MEKIKAGAIISILIFAVTGCGGLSVEKPENPKSITEDSDHSMDYRKFIALAQAEGEKMDKGNLSVPIDYEFLDRNYGVYVENICTDPHSIEDNPIILDLVKDNLNHEKEMRTKIPEIPEEDHDYFVFDFNGDGLDDYLVCFHGIIYSGSAGNLIRMYIQEDGGYVERLSVTAEIFIKDPHEHEAIAVLNRRVEGYYSLVLPWTKNRVWSYDSEKEWYGTCKYADEKRWD